MEGDLAPRLCFLNKGKRGYGFHLHGERNKGGQFIRKVEPGSSADMAGLRPGDRVVEVNGQNVEHETHHQVVNRIREVPHRTRLLVVDRPTDDLLRSRGLACTEDLAVEMGTLSPRPSPRPTPSTSPVPRGTPPRVKHTRNAPTNKVAQGEIKRSSETSSAASDTERLHRLCHLVMGERGYGFYLHSDKTKRGQFVRVVDPGSAADSADVRPGDRLVEVNGVNVEGLRHSEVVALIRAGGEEVRLLMVDPETDELFLRLGVPPTPSPTAELPATDPPSVNIELTDSPITKTCPESRLDGSSASQSSRSSTTQSEINPFVESGLRLSPTAAEARQKFLASRGKKRAPPMDWNKRQEIFSNF
uniref:Na(+)/H(+) exchange regulatory cofactor NHE-RF n=1 Tax=Mola mola TaxID=94237 RepID=A0A3Q3XB41_MOLML